MLANHATDRKAVASVVVILSIDVSGTIIQVRIQVVTVRVSRGITRPPVAIGKPIVNRTIRPVVVAGAPMNYGTTFLPKDQSVQKSRARTIVKPRNTRDRRVAYGSLTP